MCDRQLFVCIPYPPLQCAAGACYERTLLLRARHILYLHVFDTLTSFT